jgi:ribosomal-protein-alanine N-acetyltransferase
VLTDIPLDFELADKVVRLRAPMVEDAPALFEGALDPEVRRFTTFPEAEEVNETIGFIRSESRWRADGSGINFAIRAAGEDRALGMIGLSDFSFPDRRAEIGYWIAPPGRRRGLTVAAVRLLGAWAMGPPLGLVRIELRTDPENAGSRRVAERAGYAYEGILRSYLSAKGRRWDMAQYALVAEP